MLADLKTSYSNVVSMMSLLTKQLTDENWELKNTIKFQVVKIFYSSGFIMANMALLKFL